MGYQLTATPTASQVPSMSDLDITHPAISDLRRAAKRRLPHFVFEYLDSGTGDRELGIRTNRQGLDDVVLMPSVLHGHCQPDLSTKFLGTTYARPFGIAPIGMSGLIWPNAECLLAAEAQKARIPYGLSTVATRLPEDVGPVAGDMGWFQLYPPANPEFRRDMIRRAKNSGFTTLVMTVDVPADSRRERQRRANLTVPFRIKPQVLWAMLTHPTWTLGTLRHGAPSLKLAEDYATETEGETSVTHAGHAIRGYPNWDDVKAVRQEWDGPLIVKGVQRAEDAVRMRDAGVDAVWVSNHSARQFEGGPSAISSLAPIRAAVGDAYPLIFDSGIEGGLDIVRALHLGADFVMLGRAWHYALAGLGPQGVRHLIHLLSDDMVVNMGMLGAHSLSDLRGDLMRPSP